MLLALLAKITGIMEEPALVFGLKSVMLLLLQDWGSDMNPSGHSGGI